MAVEYDIAKKSGAWYTYDGEQLGQGRENAKAYLTANPEIMMQMSEKVRSSAGLDGAVAEFTEADEQPIELD
jgi:recombination protein RecA